MNVLLQKSILGSLTGFENVDEFDVYLLLLVAPFRFNLTAMPLRKQDTPHHTATPNHKQESLVIENIIFILILT